MKSIKFLFITIILLPLLMLSPAGLHAITGEDGSVWVQVSPAGFGNQDNVSVVALKPFQGELYAITRNDVTGFELWKTAGTGWTKITVPGLTDNSGFFGWIKPGAGAPQYNTKYNLKQNTWGDLIEFNGSLYFAISTGNQGAQLYGSQGFEIWRFNGTIWEAIAAQSVDVDESGTLTGLSDCTDGDGDTTAAVTDSIKAWTTDEWAGCVLRVEGEFDGSEGTDPGDPGIRVFDIISNTGDTLTIQEHEDANAGKYTICAEHRIRRDGDTGRPDSVVPAIDAVDDDYTIECGLDERGFGEMWNKSIVDFETLNGELYATIGLNYPDGARIWKTSDGADWTPSSEYSFGVFHGSLPDKYPGNPGGNPVEALDPCVLDGFENRDGDPVSSSVTNLGKSAVTGIETLYTGGTGTTGCNGRGARVARLDGSDWNLIVDWFVDGNDTGTNENGFGVADDFPSSNFQAWSWEEYDNLLFVSVIRLQGGSRIMYTSSGSDVDGAWLYSMGGDATVDDGFGDVTNIGSHLYAFDSALYAGTISNLGILNLGATTNGADIWKGTGPGTAITWTRVTGNGFGDESIAQFEAFTTFGGNLYLAGSNITASGFRGEEEEGYSGAKVFRLVAGVTDDRDEDGTLDSTDNCPLTPNGPSEGTCTSESEYSGVACTVNGDCGIGGVCSLNQEDTDTDGVGDVCDNCPGMANPAQVDTDNDGVGYVCDNCPTTPNADQENSDLDTLGDACDNCPVNDNEDQTDTDGDCVGNDCDADPNDPDNPATLVDADTDGIGDACDNCPDTTNAGQDDTYPSQGNGIGDACDCEANFDCDQDVDADDVTTFLQDFGRGAYFNPCVNDTPCSGDFICDGDVDADDVTIFLEDFGRGTYFQPCPVCPGGDWCVY